MRFYPENVPPKYNNENEVWQVVKATMNTEEGAALHGYRIKRFSGKEYMYAADIVVLSRRLGAVIIECKGCSIQHIYQVRNTVWKMQNFYAETIRPIEQVEDQKYALMEQARKRGVAPEVVKYRTVVALPFITRMEWRERGFQEDSINENIAFQEDLTPATFLPWLERRQQSDPQPKVTDAQWREICTVFELQDDLQAASTETTPGKGAPPETISGLPSKLTLWQYEGSPPLPEDLEEVVPELAAASKHDYWYLVATSGLAHLRRDLAPEIQIVERLNQATRLPGVKMQFRQALGHLILVEDNQLPATKFEEVTSFKRVTGLMEQDQTRSEQLKRDRYSWLEALRAVEERGWNVKIDQIELVQHFAHPRLAQLLGEVQSDFHAELAAKGKFTFEQGARAFLQRAAFRPPKTVIMEGFTRLTPLQQTFIERCLEVGNCHVIMVYPYRAVQEEGFRAVQVTYARLADSLPARRHSPLLPMRDPSALRQLSVALFQSSPASIAPDQSVQLHAALNRTEEVERALDILLAYREKHPEADVALVTRDPEGYKPLLREAASRRGPEVEGLFDLPAVHLLLTPVGRFIRHLYDAWDAGSKRLNLEAENFSQMLASGWLGKRARESSVLFRALIPAYFTRCKTFDDWNTTLQGMRHTPALGDLQAWAAPADLDLWLNRLQAVRKLVNELFTAPQAPLHAQIALLEQALTTLEIDDVEEAEQAVIRRVLEVFHEFVDNSEFEVSAGEVAEIISAIVREVTELENHFRITLTAPESVDSLSKDLIYYLGLDDARVPRPPADEWPLILPPPVLQQHYDFERYLFLSVVRAAKQELHLSYAEVDGQQPCRASLYLEEVAALMNRPVPRAVKPKEAEGERPNLKYPPLQLKRRQEYLVSELAQLQVCPRRAYLERLTGSAQYYRNAWQSDLLVQGVLFSMATRRAEALWPGGLPDDLDGVKLRLGQEVEQQGQAQFPGIHPSRWPFLTRQVVDNLLNSVKSYQESVSALPRVRFRRHSQVKGQTIRLRGGYYGTIGSPENPAWSLNSDSLAQTWLLPSKREDTRRSAFDWWQNQMQNLTFKSRSVVDAQLQEQERELLNTNAAPRPGPHCTYCPVAGLCLAQHSREQQ
ncbi:exodeoxyribonuclease V subunit gamma (plasmid) [Deinococcus taeanensis]|uniref:NERD domain-containing protein n=1 Tax=Deinococcus taeanensis TaxID=2737050 RepID=UPI001CDCDC33|nr:NERD domain-containing protein [Deinococcus taeanensis]UBV45529.1 exodeoxyribonuclease V subunit gamma [Deinococcus taeanensis]